MKYVAYHRVSTREQHLDRGVSQILRFCKEQGIRLHKDKVYTDKNTGKDFIRPSYIIVKEELLEEGDALILTELDRLGRNKKETLKEMRYFAENGIKVMILELPTTLQDFSNLGDSLSKMMTETFNNFLIEMYASFAQAEMEKRERRQREGIEEMKKRGEWGKYGRPHVLDFGLFCREYEKVLRGELKPTQLYRSLNISKSTYYDYKKRHDKEKEERKEKGEA